MFYFSSFQIHEFSSPLNAILPQFFKKRDSGKPIALSSRKRFFLRIGLSTLMLVFAERGKSEYLEKKPF